MEIVGFGGAPGEYGDFVFRGAYRFPGCRCKIMGKGRHGCLLSLEGEQEKSEIRSQNLESQKSKVGGERSPAVKNQENIASLSNKQTGTASSILPPSGNTY